MSTNAHRENLANQLAELLRQHEQAQKELNPDDSGYKQEWSQLECLCDDLRAMLKHIERRF